MQHKCNTILLREFVNKLCYDCVTLFVGMMAKE
nr:MAG TPA: hypothetical protein [Caudoviricetes sp.]